MALLVNQSLQSKLKIILAISFEVVENQPFDEAVDVGETSDVASEYTPTPRGPARVNPLPAGVGGGSRRSVLVNPVGGAEGGPGGDPISPSASLSTTPRGTGRGSQQVRLRETFFNPLYDFFGREILKSELNTLPGYTSDVIEHDFSKV